MKNINLLLFLFLLPGCVSVSLQKPLQLKKSKVYSLVTPPPTFEKQKLEAMDQYWRNSQTGNAISVQTACSPNYDPSLQDLIQQNIAGIEESRKLQESRFDYNERVALRAEYKGQVDGIPVKINLVSFKKNNCSYILSYFGKSISFSADLIEFEKFLKNFKAR